MGKFRVGITLPGEYVFRGVRARDPLEAIDKAEETLLKIAACFDSGTIAISIPAPLRLELDFSLEAFVEELNSGGKVIREFDLNPGPPWKVIAGSKGI